MNTVDSILNIVDAILQMISSVVPGAQIADVLVKIAQKANQAYQEQTGQPIDPELLKPIDPVE